MPEMCFFHCKTGFGDSRKQTDVPDGFTNVRLCPEECEAFFVTFGTLCYVYHEAFVLEDLKDRQRGLRGCVINLLSLQVVMSVLKAFSLSVGGCVAASVVGLRLLSYRPLVQVCRGHSCSQLVVVL